MLSNVIRTEAFNPDKHANDLTVYRVDPNLVPLGNIRLCEVGATQTGGTDVLLPKSSGVAELIENVYVELDGERLADNPSTSRDATNRNLMMGNDLQKSLLSELAKTEIGTIAEYQAPINSWGTDGGIRAAPFSTSGRNTLTGSSATTAKGRIRLGDFIDFFNKTQYLPKLPNLIITIEWKNLLTANVLQYSVAPTSYTILPPKLVMDIVTDRPSLEKISPELDVFYLDVIDEFQNINAVADGSTATQTVKPQAFNHRYLQNLTIVNEASTDHGIQDAGLGYNGSIAQKDETIQLIVNGSDLLPELGCKSSAHKQMFYYHSRGALCVPYSGYTYAQDGQFDYLNSDLIKQVGRQSYGAFDVGAEIGSLNVRYTREGTAQAHQSSALSLHMYGRCWKHVMLKDNKAVIEYVSPPVMAQ